MKRKKQNIDFKNRLWLVIALLCPVIIYGQTTQEILKANSKDFVQPIYAITEIPNAEGGIDTTIIYKFQKSKISELENNSELELHRLEIRKIDATIFYNRNGQFVEMYFEGHGNFEEYYELRLVKPASKRLETRGIAIYERRVELVKIADDEIQSINRSEKFDYCECYHCPTWVFAKIGEDEKWEVKDILKQKTETIEIDVPAEYLTYIKENRPRNTFQAVFEDKDYFGTVTKQVLEQPARAIKIEVLPIFIHGKMISDTVIRTKIIPAIYRTETTRFISKLICSPPNQLYKVQTTDTIRIYRPKNFDKNLKKYSKKED